MLSGPSVRIQRAEGRQVRLCPRSLRRHELVAPPGALPGTCRTALSRSASTGGSEPERPKSEDPSRKPGFGSTESEARVEAPGAGRPKSERPKLRPHRTEGSRSQPKGPRGGNRLASLGAARSPEIDSVWPAAERANCGCSRRNGWPPPMPRATSRIDPTARPRVPPGNHLRPKSGRRTHSACSPGTN